MALGQLASRAARAAGPQRAPRTRRFSTAAPPRRASTVAAADAAGDGGLASRVTSPADALALPPRLALGALMALPDVLNDPSAVQSWLSSLAAGAPADALAGAEAALAAAADRGALAEAELRGLLPAELAAALPPLPPAREPPAPEGRPVNPAVTFSPGPPRTMPVARFQGGLAANRVGSELERLAQEVAAVRDALGAARAGGALRAVAARDARAALASHLRQLASGTGSEAEAWAAEPAAAAALADAQALSDELAKLTL